METILNTINISALFMMIAFTAAATAEEIIAQYDFNGDPGTAAVSTNHPDIVAAGDIIPTEWQKWDLDAQNASYHPQDVLWVQTTREDGEIDFNVTITEGKELTINSVSVDHRSHVGGAPFDQITWYYNDKDDGSGNYILLGSETLPNPNSETFRTSTVTPATPPAGLSGTVHLRAVFRNRDDFATGRLDNFTLNGTINSAPVQGTLFITK